MAAYRRVYDLRHLQADCKNRDQLRNPTFVNRVWATFLDLGAFGGFLRFLTVIFVNFIFCKALLCVAYLGCRQYARNSTAASIAHILIKSLIQSD